MALLRLYIVSGFIILFFYCLNVVDGGKSVIIGSLGSQKFCRSVKDKTRWLSEKSSVLVIGKSEQPWSKECSIVFGAGSDARKSVRLRIHFDFIYIDNCGVKIQINQSSTSNFKTSKDNTEMFMTSCNHVNPGPLYAEPKNYIKISLSKVSKDLEGYNFRLNVSLAENLPVTGLSLHVVIIVSFVCILVVIMAAFVLVKYACHMSIKWSEERSEERSDRAINLYQIQESPTEETTQTSFEPSVGARSRHKNERLEIAVVSGDGRVERIQPLGGEAEGRVSETSYQPQGNPPALANGRDSSPGEEPTHFYIRCPNRHNTSAQGTMHMTEPSSGSLNDNLDTSSVGGLELPPSYEEALGMPLPSSPSSSSGRDAPLNCIDSADKRLDDVRGATCGNDTRDSNKGTVDADVAGPYEEEDLIVLDEETVNYMNLRSNVHSSSPASDTARQSEDV